MGTVFPGRYTAALDGSFVVFMIGMRVNKLWAVHKWLPVARAMRPMVEHLLAHRALGLLHVQYYLYWRGGALVQYWRSFEQLERFARDPSLAHLDAWKRFNRAVGSDGSVGIWHETYRVPEGHYTSIYANMPRMGLAVAGSHLPSGHARETPQHRRWPSTERSVASHETPAAQPSRDA
jgi:hypothetical protein